MREKEGVEKRREGFSISSFDARCIVHHCCRRGDGYRISHAALCIVRERVCNVCEVKKGREEERNRAGNERRERKRKREKEKK